MGTVLSRRAFAGAAIGTAVGWAGGRWFSPSGAPGGKRPSPQEIFKHSRGSVVVIDTPSGFGTGFCAGRVAVQGVDAAIVVTADHVTDKHNIRHLMDQEIATITTWDTTTAAIGAAYVRAELVDTAVFTVGLELEPLALADHLPEVGEPVHTIGHPHNKRFTFSSGIVTGYQNLDGYMRLLHSTPVSPGNSGGPVFNQLGQVVGLICSSERGAQNLNYAIPFGEILAMIWRLKALAKTV